MWDKADVPAAAGAAESLLCNALAFVQGHHRGQMRKGGSTPYIAHLLNVSGLTLDQGGDEELAAAAMLHDALEDALPEAEDEVTSLIRGQYGDRVLHVVLACTDELPSVRSEMPWRLRKERYLRRLREESSSDVLLVASADKLDNARALLLNLRYVEAPEVWSWFKGGKDGTLWYYQALAEVLGPRGPGVLGRELSHTVEQIVHLAR